MKPTYSKKTFPREYGVWRAMISRCENRLDSNFARYGARDIKVCRRWRGSFQLFMMDLGLRPSPDHSLERLNNDGDYEPTNVVWATRVTQARNRRSTRIVTVAGEDMSLAEAAERSGVPYKTLFKRLADGCPLEKALVPGDQRKQRSAA